MSRHRRYARDLRAYAESLGWVGQPTANNHVRWTHPEVTIAWVTGGTPSKDCTRIEKRRFAKLLEDARAAKINPPVPVAVKPRSA